MIGIHFTEEEFKQKADYFNVPEHIVDGLWLYLNNRIEPGGFLEAVLSNNLKEAFGRADHINISKMFETVQFLYNCFPSIAWGSEEKFNNWIKNSQTEEN